MPDSSHENHEFDYHNNPTWRIFRIMSEFVEGFSFLARIQKSVTIFGSARLPQSHPYCCKAYELSKSLAQRGYTIVTGGGPGIMEAANHGAFDANGMSIGLNIQLPMEQRINQYVTQGMNFSYFFSRKVMLDFSAEAYIFFPGGYGTMDEFFELVTLMQTGKIEKYIPLILVGTSYWTPLIDWMREEMVYNLDTIDAQDLQMWTLTDDIDLIVRTIEQGVRQQTKARIQKKGRSRKSPEDPLTQATGPNYPSTMTRSSRVSVEENGHDTKLDVDIR
jgi:uncharacterized protein (TIGR00730 family)